MAKRVLHIDHSAEGHDLLAETLRAVGSDFELKRCANESELVAILEAEKQAPWMVILDAAAAGAFEVLSRIKRDPRHHLAAVVFCQQGLDETKKILQVKQGVYAHLDKPLAKPSVEALFKKYLSQAIDPRELEALDHSYAEETLEMIEQMHKQAHALGEQTVKELYRFFHTIKGGANSFQFPHLGEFMHLAESFLTSVMENNLYGAPEVVPVLNKIFSFVETQAEQIKGGMLMSVPPAELLEEIQVFKAKAASGWKPEPKVQSAPQPGAPAQQQAPAAAGPIVSKSATSIRIKNENLDDLQKRFKRILQLRVKLSSFSNQLKQEFFDEAFPNDLTKMVEELTQECSQIMEFFIALRVVPAARLKTFSNRVVTQTVEQLGKPARLEFSCEEGLEIDQSVVETLENGLTHLLRNSIDHGLEKAEKRAERGKDPTGTIRLDVRRDGKDKITLTIEDDGGGINQEALKAAVRAKKLLPDATLEQLSPDNVNELIFIDGLSTKTDVTDISGRGVGLSAVKENIVNLGGLLKVQSTEGNGTRFVISVPRYFKL